MSYSQKYCLVSFIQPIDSGTEFTMADWPLHITLADTFAVDQDITYIASRLTELLSEQPAVITRLSKEATLGITPVILVDKTKALDDLHISIIDFLEQNRAMFNSPEFVRQGFLPHCTVQKTAKLHVGDSVSISTIALVDMFPGADWRQRKVLNVFPLHSTAAR